MKPLKAMVIKPYEKPKVEVMNDLEDLQDTVEGFIENVYLQIKDGPRLTLIVNDSFLLGQFDQNDVNHLATAVCISGGRADIMVLGPAILAGPVDREGELRDIPKSAIDYFNQMWWKWQQIKKVREGSNDVQN